MELNHRPHAYQACALTELSYRPKLRTDSCEPRRLSDQAWPQAVVLSESIILDLSKLNSDMLCGLEPLSFLRKEVIQPLVPQRLPCYDFTPIINHTIGACPPEGLAQRLPVQSTLMV